MIYLDYNATAPMRDEVCQAMMGGFALQGNPSSVHGAGREARAIIETARAEVATLAGAAASEVIFTSGATEANNLVLRGWPNQPQIFVSAIEHDSIMDSVTHRQRLPVNNDGHVRCDILAAMLKKCPQDRPILVSVMLANHETGIVQPLAKIRDITRKYAAFLHVDAVQAAGKLPLDFVKNGWDAMSLSAHKIAGPKGVGALILSQKVEINAQITGGGQERRLRSGTENLTGIVGFGRAAKIAMAKRLDEYQRLADLRDFLEEKILAQHIPVEIVGRSSTRLPHMSQLILAGVPAETQVIFLDLAGFAVSAGAACSSGTLKSSTILSAMGFGADKSSAGLRISLGWRTTMADVEAFVTAYAKMAQILVK